MFLKLLCVILFFAWISLITYALKLIFEAIPKCNINDYFYCSITNQICMRLNFSIYKKYGYDYHQEHLYDGFDKLEKNETYHCKSHSLTLHYLQQLEKSGHVEILDDKRSTASKKIVSTSVGCKNLTGNEKDVRCIK